MIGVRELKNNQEKFYRFEQQVHVRKVSGTTVEKFAQHFQECFQEVEVSVDCLEPFDDSLSAMDATPVDHVERPSFHPQRFHLVPGRSGAERRCGG